MIKIKFNEYKVIWKMCNFNFHTPFLYSSKREKRFDRKENITKAYKSDAFHSIPILL